MLQLLSFSDAAANKKNAEQMAQILVLLKSIQKQNHTLAGRLALLESAVGGQTNGLVEFPQTLPTDTLIEADKLEKLVHTPEMLTKLVRILKR